MRLLLKILLAPIIITLTLIVRICSALLYISSWVFGLAGVILGILAVLVMLSGSIHNGIIVLIFAALVSPYGLPMLATWMIGQVQRARFALMEI